MTARAIEDSTKAGEVAAGAEAKADGVRKLVNTIGWIGAVGDIRFDSCPWPNVLPQHTKCV